MEQLYMLPNLCWQYHTCWCSGDFRSQGISRHGIDPKSQNVLSPASEELTHWGRVTHTCVSKLPVTIIGSDNGLSPGRRQAIIRTHVGILLIRTLGTHFSEILGEIHSFSFKKMHLKMSSAKGRLFSLGLNELTWAWNHIINLYLGQTYFDFNLKIFSPYTRLQ